jgi:phage-related protein
VKFEQAVYVLHAFQKKSPNSPWCKSGYVKQMIV